MLKVVGPEKPLTTHWSPDRMKKPEEPTKPATVYRVAAGSQVEVGQ